MTGIHGKAGFTLIEVLVALAIFALLAGVLYGALNSVTRAYDAAEQAVDDAARLRIGTDFLSRIIETAYPLALADGRDWVAQFNGDDSSLRFTVDLPGYVGASGVHEVVLRVREVDGETGLWFAWRPMMMEERGVVGEFQERVLIPGVTLMRLRYFGAGKQDEEPGWSEEWTHMAGLPALVELALADEGEQEWPVLSLRPKANTLRYLSVSKGGAPAAGEREGDDDLPDLPQQVGQPQLEGGAGALR